MWKSCIIFEASKTMNPLTTKENNPNESMWKGMVIILRNGFKVRLSTPRTKETCTASNTPSCKFPIGIPIFKI